MFDHSIRVPRLYKNASKIAKQVSESKGSIKQLVYESKHPNIKALYALIVHTFQRTDDIEKLLKKSKLLVKEPRLDPWLAKILITELLWGKKRLSGEAKPVKTILAYEQILKAHLSDASDDFQDFQVDKPRYARINTLKISVNEAIEGFRSEGWILKRYTDKSNYLGFLEAVANLGPEEFMIDLHIPYLLIFPPKTEFYQHRAYKNGTIMLQDKASCLPVHMLNPEPGSTVLDMCAAPGMKTTHCAAVLEDKGKIYAVEIGKKRFQILNKMIETSGATCIEAINADALTLTGNQYPNVEYILVDPSCSGSGITDRVEIGQQNIEQHKDRLEKLAGFQIKMLRHALTRFPKARRVVYSTCSVYPEENEDVVRQVLETCTSFKLVPADQFVMNKWENFGSSEFGDIGNYCLYSKPDIDLTSGFFVAVFERLEEGETNPFLNTKLYSRKLKNRGRKNIKEEVQGEQQIFENLREKGSELNFDEGFENVEADVETQRIRKKKKKLNTVTETLNEEFRIKVESSQDLPQTEELVLDERENITISKKKKKKDRSERVEEIIDKKTDLNNERNDVIEEVHKKKIKKEKHESGPEQEKFLSEGHPNMATLKKKNKKEYEEGTVDREAESKNEKEDVANEDEVYKTKKIKREKHQNDLEEKFLSEEHQNMAGSKKKKKKGHGEDIVDREAGSTNEKDFANEDDVLKKKKRKKEESEQRQPDEDQNIASAKKKKKKKDRSELAENEAESYIDREDEVCKSEKRKKERHQNELETSTDFLELGGSTEHKKKKKKVKSVDLNENSSPFEKVDGNKEISKVKNDILSCDDDVAQEKRKSKKKKTE